MQEASSSTIVGVFRSQSATDQAAKALHDAGLECQQMRDMISSTSNTSNGFFGDLKGFFTGTSANTSYIEDNASNPLITLGLSREAAQYYSNEYSQGNPVLVVHAQGREQEILDILSRYGAYNAQIKSADEMQPLTNTSPKNSYEMSVPLNDTQSWESYPQAPIAQETSLEDRQQNTEPFSTLGNSSSAVSSDDQVPQVDENTPANSWYSEAPLPEGTTTSDISEPDTSAFAQEEETPMTRASADSSENGVEELDTPEAQADIHASENAVEELGTQEAQQEEEEFLVAQDNSDILENSGEELDILETQQEEEEPLVAQDNSDILENSGEKLDTPEVQQEEEMPMAQANVDASEKGAEEFDTPAIQSDVYSSQTPQAATEASTQAEDVESSPQSITAPEQTEELQQLQEEIKLMQQQLQSAKTSLDAIKERERQYKKRQKQLQNTKKQLQNLQAELQATQTELQETVLRVASHQNLEIESSPKPSEKPKKSKKQKKSAVFSVSE